MDHTNATPDNNGRGAIIDRDRFYQMCELGFEEQVKEFTYAGVNKDQLELISCVQLENLDVDIDARHGNASAATFFEPSGPIDDELKSIFGQYWEKLGPGQAPRLYPQYMASWFTQPWAKADPLESDELEMDRFGGTSWQCLYDRMELAETMGLMLPEGVLNLEHTHQYFSDIAFFPKDKKKPHLACIISDTFICPDTPLRSEVHGAVALIKYQLARRHCTDHRIKPVMLYTFQMEDYARITEAYYDRDTGKIMLRQSRQLDLRGPKPTDDAWLLLRWVLNTPIGDTLDKEEVCSLPIRVKEPAVSLMKPTPVVATPAVST